MQDSLLKSKWARRVVGTAGALIALKVLQKLISAAHKLPEDPHELIAQKQSESKAKADKTGVPVKRCLVVGTGITGIGAIKSCLEEGLEVVCYEKGDDVAGFWRYKEDENAPSVYKSVYIDTPRDINSYGDMPYPKGSPVFTHNTQLVEYLEANVKEFQLNKYITFGREVEWITKSSTPGLWSVQSRDVVTGEKYEDFFDGVLICTGRHGAAGYIPHFPGLDETPIKTLHSSMYKYPTKHGIDKNSKVIVVGVGNSGLDIVTESSENAGETHWVSRSGLWLSKTMPGEENLSIAGAGRSYIDSFFRIPWWWLAEVRERANAEDQAIINKHGLKPKHRMHQQHELVTGMFGPTIHEQLEAGKIKVHKSLKRFETDGNGVSCVVLGGVNGEEEKIEADVVIFCTGFRSSAGFVNPKCTADMRFGREGTDVPLYKGFLAIPQTADDPYTPIAFINFIQTATFMGAEVQSHYYGRILQGEIKLPSPEVMTQDMIDTRMALAAQYIDREQLKTQHGIGTLYYDELYADMNNLPSLGRLLIERPTAIWHWYFGGTSLAVNSFQYRLVGPGAYRKAEEYIERLYFETLDGDFVSGPKKGTPKPKHNWFTTMLVQLALGAVLQGAVVYAGLLGYATSVRIKDRKAQNIAYLKRLGEEDEHSLELNKDSKAMQTSTADTRKIAAASAKEKSFRNDFESI